MFENSKVQNILKVLLRKKSHVVLDVMCENHLVIFYPLPYFPLETINYTLKLSSESMQTSTKYSELQFHWVSLFQIADLEFQKAHISSFELQIVAKNSEKLCENLLGD